MTRGKEMEETKIEEIVRMLRRMDIRQLRRVYFFVLGMMWNEGQEESRKRERRSISVLFFFLQGVVGFVDIADELKRGADGGFGCLAQGID